MSRVGTSYEPALCRHPASETGSGDSAEPPLQAPPPEGTETGAHDASSPIPSSAAPYSGRPGMNSYKSLDTKRQMEPSATGHRTRAWSPENARTTANMHGTEHPADLSDDLGEDIEESTSELGDGEDTQPPECSQTWAGEGNYLRPVPRQRMSAAKMKRPSLL